MCSHLCFPPPHQLPGPEAKLFVEMACVAVSHVYSQSCHLYILAAAVYLAGALCC